MASDRSRNAELQQLWADYEASLWAGLAAVKYQATITEVELDELSAGQRKALRILSRLSEIIDR